MKNLNKIITSTVLASLFIGLFGCAATNTAIKKRDLTVDTRMSQTIFLEPVSDDKKKVYVQVRNSSAVRELDLEKNLTWALANRGYTIVRDPERANFLIQANVLKIGKFNLREADSALSSGFGGGLLGATIAGATGGNGRTMVGAGLAGAALGVALDTIAQDICYSLVTDIQISERVQNGKGTKGVDSWKRYQTRVVSNANQVNLKFEDAAPELVYGVSQSIAGLM